MFSDSRTGRTSTMSQSDPGSQPAPVPSHDDKRLRAEAVRQTLWGPGHAERMALLRRFEPGLADVVLVESFGGTYADERLTLRERNLVTLASLATQGKAHQLRSHLQAALRIGFTPDQLSAVFGHLFLYVGLPSVIEALRTLDGVLTGEEASQASQTMTAVREAAANERG